MTLGFCLLFTEGLHLEQPLIRLVHQLARHQGFTTFFYSAFLCEFYEPNSHTFVMSSAHTLGT